MIISIVNKNCDFDKEYLIEESADSSIEIQFELERIVTVQSKKVTQNTLTEKIVNELQRYKWLILGKVQIEIHWLINAVERQETDKIGDLDNITKPILDTLSGINGLLIDDSQINSIHTTWTSKNGLKKDNVIKLIINFNNDYAISKSNLYFLQTAPVVFTPLNFDIDNKGELIKIKLFLEAFKLNRVFSGQMKSTLNVNVDRYLVYSEYEFHRTRLNKFNKNQIISDSEFYSICKKNRIDI